LGLILIGVHFGVPVSYFFYLKRTTTRPWNLHTDPRYEPTLTIIVPTYNEEDLIVRKLDDILSQTYPRNRLTIIVADDCSLDGTTGLVKEWILAHPEIDTKIMIAANHAGKMPMVRKVFQQLGQGTDLVALTDVDAFWDHNAISNATRYFADNTVGSVTGSIQYSKEDNPPGEKAYRDFYNDLRVSESKIFATPIQNGPFLVLRSSALIEYGLPDFPGVDDSAVGSFFAFAGLRAIQVDDVMVWEPARGNMLRKKTRRANRLIMNFTNTRKCAIRLGVYRQTPFETIWRIEWWLHIVNPWLLIAGAVLLLVDMFVGHGYPIAPVALLIGGALMFFAPYRAWMIQQFYLIAARLRNFRTSDIIWQR
jgi:poly-beta-1,6-N-acetyl-D-glucosamine synthase